MSRFAICGLSHHTAPVGVREKLALPSQSLPEVLSDMLRADGVRESLILSTCNRVELALALDERASFNDAIDRFLQRHEHLRSGAVEKYLYKLEGREAMRHLFRVASSLDSMVVGEPQILGQLKDAYTLAKDLGAVNGFLDQLVTRAFHVAKRVRTETEIGSAAVSVSYAAVELAREIFGSLSGSTVMLVGAGKMSELAARHLKNVGAKQIYVTNRTHDRALDLARSFEGRLVEFASFKQTLPDVDIVITSTGAREPILIADDIKQIMRARKNRPMFLVDIAVPRNIDPAAMQIDNVFLYDIDDLQKVVDKNVQGRAEAAERASLIIEEELAWMESRLRERQVSPSIVALQARLEAIRAAEMERFRSKLGPLSPQQEEALEGLTRGIVNKFAHGPIAELRRAGAQGESQELVDLLQRMFRLEGDPTK
jgi:glutamyl-tRNA reductase